MKKNMLAFLTLAMLSFFSFKPLYAENVEFPQESDTDLAMTGENNFPIYDIYPLHSYLNERIDNLEKIIASFPRKMNRDQKCFYWMHQGKMQAYKEIFSTIDLLRQNTH